MKAINKEWSYNKDTHVYTLKVILVHETYGGYSLTPCKKATLRHQIFYGITKNECENKLKAYKDNLSHQVIKNNNSLLKFI